MTDLISLTTSAIATVAFQKFLESGAGELGKKYTTEAIAKMESLLKRIWTKLRGKPRIEEVKAAIEQNHKITPEQINQIAAYLQVAMDDDPQFADEIRLMAQQINAGKIQDNSSMTQNNYGSSTGYQAKVEGGTSFQGGTHYHGKET